MSIFDKVNMSSKVVSEKAKNISELNNLKRKIAYEEERIVEIFSDIGRSFYKNPDGNHEDLKVFCEDIDTRRRRIKKMIFEVNNMRGYKICPKCNAEVNGKFKFCGTCGSKIPSPEEEDFENYETTLNEENVM